MDEKVIELVPKESHPIRDGLANMMRPENIQRYILGTKKNGDPRAVYDIIRDQQKDHRDGGKKKKKKKKNLQPGSYAFYLNAGKKKKKHKKKKKKNKDKFWPY